MPAEAREQVTKLGPKRYRLRYYDRKGGRHSGGVFPSESAARRHYRETIEPELNGRPVARRDLTLQELVDTFLDRHGKVASDRTIRTLRGRLKKPLDEFGTVRLDEFERMADEVAAFAASLPDRYRYSVVSALRQALEAGIRWGYITRNPAKLAGRNPQPPPRGARVYTPAELKAIVEELDALNGAAVTFAAATGLRPAEWAHLERKDVDKTRRVLTVHGTKTVRSPREVPLTRAALDALDDVRARIDSRYLFASIRGGPFDLHNFRNRVWIPAIDSAGVEKPARLYDLRSTFASNALAAGITTFELARIMGTSVGMIEAHYGALIDSAHDGILKRLEAIG